MLAIGIDDLAGTGYFAREYLVSTYNFNHFKLSFGAGWGKFDVGNGLSNPLGIFSDHFKKRDSGESGVTYGGTLNAGNWFAGDASLFGGIEWFVPYGKGLRVKIENDPFNYFDFSAGLRKDASFVRRKSDSKINFGLSFPLNKYGFIDVSYVKGNYPEHTLLVWGNNADLYNKLDKISPVSYFYHSLFKLNTILIEQKSIELTHQVKTTKPQLIIDAKRPGLISLDKSNADEIDDGQKRNLKNLLEFIDSCYVFKEENFGCNLYELKND